jgi:glycosyltransferase involved in cell wall biosynthesis
MQPLVSILIPCFNAERWIGQTLESALNQEYARKEIIIVDDGSSDRTLEIARTFQCQNVKIAAQPNAGAPAARNKAYALAQGEYVQWLDADDLLAPNKIRLQIEEMAKIGDDRVLLSGPYATFYYRWTKAQFFDSLLYCNLAPEDYFYIKFSNDAYLQTSCWLVSRSLTDAAGPWLELRSPDDDGEYFCRVVRASNGIRFVPTARCYWRVGNLNSVNWSWHRSAASASALAQTNALCINHYLSFEDSDRSRRACLAFLRKRLIYFYPDRPDLVDEMQAIAAGLGDHLAFPLLSTKYHLIKKLFGWSAAKWCIFGVPAFRHQFRSSLDQLMYRLELETFAVAKASRGSNSNSKQR